MMIEFIYDVDGVYAKDSRWDFGQQLNEIYVQRGVAKWVQPEPTFEEKREDKSMRPERVKRK